MFRALVISVLFSTAVCACSKPSAPQNASPTAKAMETPADVSGSAETEVPIGYRTPSEGACMLHAHTAQHFRCLAGADGQCFHYGAACEPTDSCVFDVTSGQFRDCTAFAEGTCTGFAQNCTPKTRCLLDAKQNRYRECRLVKHGICQGYGSLCTP